MKHGIYFDKSTTLSALSYLLMLDFTCRNLVNYKKKKSEASSIIYTYIYTERDIYLKSMKAAFKSH